MLALKLLHNPVVMIRALLLLSILISASVQAQDLSRRALLRSFSAALVGFSQPGTLLAAGTQITAVPLGPPTPASLPWGMVNLVARGSSLFISDDASFCYVHPSDRLHLVNTVQGLMEGYLRTPGLSDGESAQIMRALLNLDRLEAIEVARHVQISQGQGAVSSNTQCENASEQELQPAVRIIDLLSRYLPADRLRRVIWQINYPEEQVLLTDDYQALERLYDQLSEQHGIIPLADALRNEDCSSLLNRASS